jgi:hypothetical protein
VVCGKWKPKKGAVTSVLILFKRLVSYYTELNFTVGYGMKLDQVIQVLATGELSQANLGSNDVDGITSNNKSMLVNHINMAMIDLYTRFPLALKEIWLTPNDHMTTYKLHSKHADTNVESTELKYINDSVYVPFKDDILIVDQVFNEIGCEVPLNDSNNCNSVFTPTFNTIQIPCPSPENSYCIVYRASPELLDTGVRCNGDADIELPHSFIPALCYFVASRFHASRTHTNSIVESASYMQKYEAACNILMLSGAYTANNTTNLKARANGWV